VDAAALSPLRWRDVAEQRAGRSIGDPLIYRPEVDSTNALAAALVPDRAPAGAVIVADHQTAGRGRLGRRWLAPAASSLTFTVVVASLDAAWAVPMATGVAIVDALADAGIAAALKWPNDLLIAGKKCAGILIETKQAHASAWLLVGIGVNVRTVDPSLPDATFLDAHLIAPIAREDLLLALLDRLELWYGRAVRQPDEVRATWRARLATLGAHVTLHAPGGRLEGLAEDVEPDGALVLRLPDGSRRAVHAGDVTMAHLGWPEWG
jgi:BirA family biotin operon repressor/biotin-[acetyl-CoA-carboxylase] ligase